MMHRRVDGGAFDIVALAASAGGLNAVSKVLAPLPLDFSAAIVVVQHLESRRKSLMPQILNKRTALPVRESRNGDLLAPGTVYISPSNRHLLVNADGTLSLSDQAPVRFLRPSADVLFASVAESYGERAIAVVLSGTGTDGTIGIAALHKRGGTVIAQDEATAEFFGMPGSAIDAGMVDYVLPLHEIPPKLTSLVTGAPR